MSGVARRLLIASGGVVASSVLVFLLLRVLPGDIATTRLGIDATPEALAALREEYGFDRSLPAQYIDWLTRAVRGDLGRSLVTGDAIRNDIVARLDVTLPIVLLSSLASVIVSAWIGQRAALHRRRPSAIAATVLSQIGVAVPTFVIGVVLITVFSVQLNLLPAGGFPIDGWGAPLDAMRSIALPVVTLAAAQTAILVRFARSQALDFISSDAFRTARSVGRTAEAALATAKRLVLSPVLGVTALQLSTLLTGAVVVESVFALPGLGSMMVRDIANRDLPKVQSTLLVVVVLVFVLRFIVDVVNDRLDPRRMT
ncbi:MAG: ABC transporter permease [Ilumatobacteraceae bacterium]